MALRRRRKTWDLLVVGGGVTGLTAANEAARCGLITAVLEAQAGYGGQVGTVNVLDDWPATAQASGVELAAALATQARSHGVTLVQHGALALTQHDEVWRVTTEADPLLSRYVLIASGARLRALGVPGEDALRGKGVSQCAHCDGHFFRGQDVAVVGGGDSALQEALVLAPLCRSVSIIVRSRLRARRAYVDRAASATNIQFVWDSVVEAVIGSTQVTGLRLRNLKTGALDERACVAVFPFIGTEPNTGFLPDTMARDGAGRLITDVRLRTSLERVYAAGAARSGYGGDLVSAAGEGAAAAREIARDIGG